MKRRCPACGLTDCPLRWRLTADERARVKAIVFVLTLVAVLGGLLLWDGGWL